MFTGIVEELGHLRSSDPTDPGATGPSATDPTDPAAASTTRMVFEGKLVSSDAKLGDSIAVNGCCLTVVDCGEGWWAADAVAETLSRTNLGRLRPGDGVNLERPVRLSDRLGGHLVQGHVDGVGVIVHPAPDLQVRAPASILPYLVEKGSVTVDGCSLTVVNVLPDGFTVAIIPHTAAVTTFGSKGPGDQVNLEVDVIAKYVERLLAAGATSPYSNSNEAPGG